MPPLLPYLLLLLGLVVPAVIGAVTGPHSATPNPCVGGFSHIIVGAGTGGPILAARISEDASTCVLLISNGGNVSGTIGTECHFCSASPPTFPPPWPVQSELGYSWEANLDNVMQPYVVKNKASGGAMAFNTGIGDRIDGGYWDNVGAISADFLANGWSRAGMQQWWNKWEDYHPGAGFPTDPATMAWHGTSGPMVTTTWPTEPPSLAFAQALAATVGIPVLNDTAIGHALGVGVVERAVDEPSPGVYVRQTTFEKYLRAPNLWNPEGTGARTNLVVWEYTTVTRVLFAALPGQEPVAIGVSYETPALLPIAGSGVVTVRPGGRVMLAASAVNSMMLMQVSGIGNWTGHLDQLLPANTIPRVYDNPAVGNNNVFQSLQGATEYLVYVPTNRSGCQTVNGNFLSSAARAAGETLPDIGIGWGLIDYIGGYPLYLALQLGYRQGGYPAGTFGHVLIKDADLKTQANVSFNMDPTPMVDAFKATRATFALAASNFGVPNVELSPGLATVPADATDAQILAYLQDTLTPDFEHCHGGNPMGAVDAHGDPLGGAVVDSRLRVIGVDGLSISDLSVMPFQIPGHAFFSTVMTIAEKAAAMALEDWHAPSLRRI